MNNFKAVPAAEEWPKLRARFLFRQRREPAHEDDPQLTASQAYGVIAQATYNALSDTRATAALTGTESFLHVDEDDFVISLRTFEGGIEHARESGCISPAYTVMRPSAQIEPMFFKYLLKCSAFIQTLQTAVIGIRDGKSVRYEHFANLVLPLPDLETQKAIADFLDRETARIDQLIEKKQRLVALLDEKAKSVNELFFLNATETDTQPLHRIYRVITGKTPSRSEENNFSDEEGLPWATPANLGFVEPVEATKEHLTDNGSEGQPIVDAGTVLLNGIGASVGKIGITGTRMSFNQQIHALIAKKKVLSDRFLFFQLLTLKDQLVLLANSTTLPILNAERLGRLQLRIFDFDEQYRHCANMDELLRHEEQTAQKINASIDRLKEYRSALITAAVTGQIDVATWGKQGQTDRRLDQIEEEMSVQEART